MAGILAEGLACANHVWCVLGVLQGEGCSNRSCNGTGKELWGRATLSNSMGGIMSELVSRGGCEQQSRELNMSEKAWQCKKNVKLKTRSIEVLSLVLP